jgi:Lon protease-like protein
METKMKNKAKYLRRRAREKENKQERAVRQREIDRKWAAIHEESRKRQQRMEEFEREWRKIEQRLVNILAKRLCQLSPEYEKELRGKQALQNIRGIFNALGGRSIFGIHTVSEEPFRAIEDKKEGGDKHGDL